ncbi:MAG: 50S ribosomal protein L24 [Myxococcota bacterium]|nr:50S ribosomal protein L24 [Myxococcota bacterium]
MSRIRQNDQVMVIAGKDKGKSGKVIAVKNDGRKVVVEKLNMVRRHTKPTQANPQGGIMDKEMPLDISNVMLLTKDNRPVRVAYRFEEVDGQTKKVRVAAQTGELID